MAFFVVEPKETKESKDIKRLDIEVLSIGKKIGLSFSEINELSMQDLIDLAKSFLGESDEGPRQATQKDIDSLFR